MIKPLDILWSNEQYKQYMTTMSLLQYKPEFPTAHD